MDHGIDILTDDERRLVEGTPEVGFLADFEAWAGKKTDAPAYTLKAAGLMALSLAAGDTVVLPNFFGAYVYMNLYILIVGPSTTLRKSTVLGMVSGLLPKNTTTGQDYIVTMDDVSSQAFNKVAAKQGALMAPILMNVDEVSGLFQTIRKQNSYLAGFDKTLMRAYDHSPIYINRVNDEIAAPRGAFINIFAASTPEPLMDVLSTDDVASGLLPRFVIFDARGAIRGRRRTLKERLEAQETWEEEAEGLRDILAGIAGNRCHGIPTGTDEYGNAEFPITVLPFTDDAIERLDVIDNAWSDEAGKDTTNWAAIKGRGFWHLMKLAGLYALSREGAGATVEYIDVLRAAHLVETTIGDLGLMQEEVGANMAERQINVVMEEIALAGAQGLAISALARKLKLSARDIQEIGNTLRVRKMIQVTDDERWRKI